MNLVNTSTLGLFEVVNAPIHLIDEDGEALLYPQLLSDHDSLRLFEALQTESQWQQDSIQLFGNIHPLPRLTAWYGDLGRDYRYSGISMRALPWSPSILEIKNVVELKCGIKFNSVLLNLYRDGRDGVAWHSDDEIELGTNPIIASVSLGQERFFKLRHKLSRKVIKTLLPNGSMLLMRGPCQHLWEHEVPKSARQLGPRINLTFRNIY